MLDKPSTILYLLYMRHETEKECNKEILTMYIKNRDIDRSYFVEKKKILLSPLAYSLKLIKRDKSHRETVTSETIGSIPINVPFGVQQTVLRGNKLLSPFALSPKNIGKRHRIKLLRLLSERCRFESGYPSGYSLTVKHLKFLYSPLASSTNKKDKWHSKKLLRIGTVGCWFKSSPLDYITRGSSIGRARVRKNTFCVFNLISKLSFVRLNLPSSSFKRMKESRLIPALLLWQ